MQKVVGSNPIIRFPTVPQGASIPLEYRQGTEAILPFVDPTVEWSDPPEMIDGGLERGEQFLAGESTGAVRDVQPAAEIVHELAEGAEQLLAEATRLIEPQSDRVAG